MGCGRVGSSLRSQLAPLRPHVAVIDQDPLAFRRLGENFPGRQVKGVGFDRETLIEAGIEQAGAFAAVSSGDNSNIIAARVARETFGVQHVVARIYDPKRAEVYERLGIPTVATVPVDGRPAAEGRARRDHRRGLARPVRRGRAASRWPRTRAGSAAASRTSRRPPAPGPRCHPLRHRRTADAVHAHPVRRQAARARHRRPGRHAARDRRRRPPKERT